MIGATLTHYRILEQLGAGGMGVVYRARDERLERDVAIKVLPAGAIADEAQRRRFHREALALSRLNHPGVATVHDFDREDETDFIVMELVSGDTLAQRLAAGPLPVEQVTDFGIQIAEALEAAHENGVLHRDLKPSNIVITPKGRIKVLDFGLAKLVHAAGVDTRATTVPTAGDAVAGTLAYMAPEQLLGEEEVSAASDVHALGVVLYEMATGRIPWRQKLSTALVNEILRTTPAPPGGLRPGLPPALDRLILTALAKSPAGRQSSAAALAAGLKAVTQAPDTTGRIDLAPRAGTPAIASLAVLPLRNLSGDPEQDFFADGMTEALITRLAQIGSLRVISYTSAMAYQGVRKPLPEIARELAVDAVVEGSVLRAGDRVRITAQLVQAASDEHLWSSTIDRPIGDILDLHSEVSQAIAEELRTRLTPNERVRLAGTRAVRPLAYDAYLRGRHFWNKRSPEGLARAVACFQESIDADPLHAPAWSGLADCYNVMGAFRWKRSRDAFPLAHAAAARALELDPDLAEGHASLGFALMYYDWDWQRADDAFRRSIALHPGYATGRQWYADFLSDLGRTDESFVEIQRAMELDPLSPVVGTGYGDTYYYARRYQEAIAAYQRTIDLDPAYRWARLNVGRALEELHRYDEAIETYEKALRDAGMTLDDSPALAHAWAASGRRERAEPILGRAIEGWHEGRVSPYSIATVFTALGDRDQAFTWFERAFEDRDRMMVSLRVHPRLDPLRDDPRFEGLLRRMGLGS
ncbi:MAG TPA: protein kinase [Candidatus Eisenbacteria bacterium]|nr:protein kinase [Candidatus Eisenbacteria bacterium]